MAKQRAAAASMSGEWWLPAKEKQTSCISPGTLMAEVAQAGADPVGVRCKLASYAHHWARPGDNGFRRWSVEQRQWALVEPVGRRNPKTLARACLWGGTVGIWSPPCLPWFEFAASIELSRREIARPNAAPCSKHTLGLDSMGCCRWSGPVRSGFEWLLSGPRPRWVCGRHCLRWLSILSLAAQCRQSVACLRIPACGPTQ